MHRNIALLAITFLLISSVSLAADFPSAEAIIAQMKTNQTLVKDMQADTKTIITSNITPPMAGQASTLAGQAPKGPQSMTQTGHVWQKGRDKSKVEITEPMKQTTITNGSIMTIIDASSGRKITQDMSKISGQGLGARGQGIDTAKALDYFYLTVTKQEGATGEAGFYVISGTPKDENKFLGRMDFIIDAERYVPVRIAMYTPKGALMSLSEIEYMPIDVATGETAYVPLKIKSIVTMQMGSVNTEMEYSNIKVNEGIEDKVFEAE